VSSNNFSSFTNSILGSTSTCSNDMQNECMYVYIGGGAASATAVFTAPPIILGTLLLLFL
jgi:hypothetical protein